MTPDKRYTAEQIIEWWKCCSMNTAGKDCSTCPMRDECDIAYASDDGSDIVELFAGIGLRAAELLNDALVRDEQRKWISVEDGMPEEHTSEYARFNIFDLDIPPTRPANSSDDVLIVCVYKGNGARFVTQDFTVNGVWASHGNPDEFDITHWRPLPDPPEEVTKDA